MTVFTEERVVELFREFVPADTTLTFEDHVTFIMQAMAHKDVQLQMQVGLYDFINIWQDFLGCARVHVETNEVVIDLVLLNYIVEGVPDHLAEALVRHIAAHEAHHLEDGRGGNANPILQLLREHDCNLIVEQRYPELEALKDQAEALSPSHNRVKARIAQIRKERGL